MYNLELERVIAAIKNENAKLVCIQLPDGLKPKADIIHREITRHTDAEVIIWGGSCFGACDIPLSVKQLGADMLIQWGHAEWQ